ncbi:hypothetical protein HDU98_005260, partial [Podochytrium sp. JEL0797]
LQDALIVAERKQEEIEGHLKAQVDFLEKNHKSAFSEIGKLASANADLMGHNNPQQKIRHIAKMKEDLVKTKEENKTLSRERDSLRRKNMILERDLESFRAVTPAVSSFGAPPTDFKFLHASKTDPEKPVPAAAGPKGPKKISRVGREVLSARAAKAEAENVKPNPSALSEMKKGAVRQPKGQESEENAENDVDSVVAESGNGNAFFVGV